MHDYNTIIGVISLKNNKASYPAIHQRYGIGNSGIDLIMDRYKESGFSRYDPFADNTYADACLDRIIHKAYRLKPNGKNMKNPI